jgi:hypothetical protein
VLQYLLDLPQAMLESMHHLQDILITYPVLHPLAHHPLRVCQEVLPGMLEQNRLLNFLGQWAKNMLHHKVSAKFNHFNLWNVSTQVQLTENVLQYHLPDVSQLVLESMHHLSYLLPLLLLENLDIR